MHSSLVVSPDGAYLATDTASGNITIWRTADGEREHYLSLDDETGDGSNIGRLKDVAFSPDGAVVAAANDGGNIRLWRVEDGSALQSMEGLRDTTGSVVFSPDGERLAVSGGMSWTFNGVELYRVSDGELLESTASDYWVRQPGTTLAFSSDGGLLAAGANISPFIRVWDIPTGEELLTERGDNMQPLLFSGGPGNEIAFNPDGSTFMASIGSSTIIDEDTVFVWEMSDRGFADEQPDQGFAVGEDDLLSGIAYLPNGNPLVVVKSDNQAEVVTLQDGKWKQLETVDVPQESIEAISPDGDLLVAANREAMVSEETERGLEIMIDLVEDVTLYRVSDQSQAGSLTGHEVRLKQATFSPDGALLAAGCGETGELVCVWDVETQALVTTLDDVSAEVHSVAFSPDGSLLAVGDVQGQVLLWSIGDWRVRFKSERHTRLVAAVTFSPDGTLLATGSGDGTVRLWHIPYVRPPMTLADADVVVEDAEGDALEGYVDVVAFGVRMDGEILDAVFQLSDLPVELTFNRDGVFEDAVEYSWVVYVDVDDDPSTGYQEVAELRGADYYMGARHIYFEGDEANFTAPIEDMLNVFLYRSNADTRSHERLDPPTLHVDPEADTITLSGTLPGLNADSRIFFETDEWFTGDATDGLPG
jgi:WD40 repeat protein